MSTSLENVLDDAERIAPQLVPLSTKLPEVVGVLIAHLESIAGHELTNLKDDVLGIAPDPTVQEQAPAGSATETQLAEARAENQQLRERLQAASGQQASGQ